MSKGDYIPLDALAALPLRACHDNLRSFRALGTIEEAAWYYATLRFNAVILEGIGYGERWEELDIKAVQDVFGRYGIELIPHIQGLSRAGAASSDPIALELSGKGETCPSASRTYDVMNEVMGRVLPVLKPRYLHVGCGEIQYIGQCPRCLGTGVSKARLYGTYVNGITSLARKHKPDIRIMIWADNLNPHHWSRLQLSEALELLYDDVILCCWNYGRADGHGGIDRSVAPEKIDQTIAWASATGHPFTGSPWRDADLCKYWSSALIKARQAGAPALGVIATNWGQGREGDEVTAKAAWGVT